MEGEEIGLVLARASELRSRIIGCVGGNRAGGRAATQGEEGEEEEEAGSLVGIRDALDSLERHLAALQALQHQQRFERESILVQIDHSRTILLSELKEYKGEELEAIHEVAAFAGEAVHADGLVLPPYPTHLPDSFISDDIGASSHCLWKNKSKPPCSGPIANTKHRGKGAAAATDKNQGSRSSNGIGHVIGLVVKSAITFVGVMSILSFAGYQPVLKKRPKAMLLFGGRAPTGRQVAVQCPQEKLMVVEDGKVRCLVKERVEVPFESDVTSPNIRYGFG
ncbi:plastid division protein PDV2-like [Musa troglodytarum]|uniref:Plastid division protein PDV2-like n=1 Tax=Musa troglodytarum TaxID=320322 RepID=A0A9E7FDX3_9LILI|nr:plastid division protein PDV2-like [Musa troglodytarum]